MVERFYRQLKSAIMAHQSPNPWTTTLPAVLLGIRSAVKELLGRSAAEMVYGTTLRLPGEFTENYTVDTHTDLNDYSDKLRIAMSRLRLCPPRDTSQKDTLQFKELETCSHVFLRRITIVPPLTAPNDRPYKVVLRSSRVFKILQKGEVETVTADRVKPVHIEREPEPGTTQKRQMQPRSLPTVNKPAVIARKPRTVRARSRSTITPQPFKTRVSSGRTTNTQSPTLGVGSGPAIAQRSNTTRARSPTRQNFIKRHILGQTLLLALPGRMGVIERTREYHCI